MEKADHVAALEKLLGVHLPGDFELKLTLNSKDLEAPLHGSISHNGANLEEISRVRFRSVACW